jgi:hypothetical protein
LQEAAATIYGNVIDAAQNYYEHVYKTDEKKMDERGEMNKNFEYKRDIITICP